MTKIIKIIISKHLYFPIPLKSPNCLYQDSRDDDPHMPVDFIHPLMTDGTGGDDQSCFLRYWLHCNKAVGAVERFNLQILLHNSHILHVATSGISGTEHEAYSLPGQVHHICTQSDKWKNYRDP